MNTQFKDFNFKLAVINELMYNQEVLEPKFDLNEFIDSYQLRTIDIEKEGYEIIPEVAQYFKSLILSKDDLAQIEEIFQDGGDDIYMNLCPFWNGEDDLFNIKSAEDLALLPNLKRITLFYDEDASILEKFEAKGVEAEWL